MRLFSKLIFSFLLSFISIGLASAQVSVPSQTFNLGTNVDGVWDQGTQTLTVQGNGKIDRDKWFHVKGTLGLEQTALNKIEFKSGVQFPDNSNGLFRGAKTSNIVFDSAMDTSNVVNMEDMFYGALFVGENSNIGNRDVSNVTTMFDMFREAKNFNADLSNWNPEKVVNFRRTFAGTTNFTTPVTFQNISAAQNVDGMFSDSSVPSVKLYNTS